MTQSSKNNYTAADIERYHSGSMPAAERHALEKAALEDPFLADALEGYRFTSTPAEDLQKIRARMEKKSGRSNPMPVYRKMNFLRAAAIILILAGAGWFTYSFLSPSGKNIARETSAPVNDRIIPSTPENKVSASDTTAVTGTETAQATTVPPAVKSMKAPGMPSANTPVNHSISSQDLEAPVDTSQGIYFNANNVKTVPAESSNNAAGNYTLNNIRNPDPLENNAYKKQVESKAVPGNVAITNDKLRKQVVNNSIIMDSVSISADKSLSGRAEGLAIRQAEKDNSDTIKHIDVVLKQEKMEAEEVVVVGYGKQKKEGYIRSQIVKVDTLEPAEGVAQFDNYIATHLKMPDELKAKNESGEVQLSFDVNSKGEPVNITVVKSLCNKCDEEAIRLLKEGPRWKKKKNKKGKVTIRF